MSKFDLFNDSMFENRFQYSWGHRAELEFKKKDCLNFAADVSVEHILAGKNSIYLVVWFQFQILKRPPISFTIQYEECNSDDDQEMEELE